MDTKDPLSSREAEILELFRRYQSDKSVARELDISAHTVATHKANIRKKLGLTAGRGAVERYALLSAAPKTKRPPLDGYWLSCFDYESLIPGNADSPSQYRKSEQINLEFAVPQEASYLTHEGKSTCEVCPESCVAYAHEFRFRVVGNSVVGIWDNQNSENAGCFQLVIHNSGLAMSGKHLGNASDGAVRSGNWLWVRVFDIPDDGLLPDRKRFRNFDELKWIMDDVNKTGRKLRWSDIFTQ